MAKPRTIRILMVEDNAIHAKIMRRAFNTQDRQFDFVHLTDGDLALDFLFHRGDYADPTRSTRPDLVLLDLRLPTVDGFDVLEAVRGDDATRALPVVIVSTSDRPEDVHRSYELGANAYVAKPADYDALTAKIRSLHDFWGDAAELPSPADAP